MLLTALDTGTLWRNNTSIIKKLPNRWFFLLWFGVDD